MTETKEKVTIGLRLASMLIDHFTMTFIMMFIVMPGFAFSIYENFNISHDPTSFLSRGMLFLFALGFSVYFNKDIFNGRSPAKRIMKMQVISNKTGKAANPLRCLVRNITIIFWPIEVIFVVLNPKRRLGDKIAGTRIEYINKPEKIKVDWLKFSIAILIAIGFLIIISLFFSSISSNLEADKVDYVESTYDQDVSEQTNNLFEMQLNGLIKEANFRVYNKIENKEGKYVTGILYFKNRNDYDNFEDSESEIVSLLTEKFPLNNHVYFLKFIYKESGSISTRQKLYIKQKN